MQVLNNLFAAIVYRDKIIIIFLILLLVILSIRYRKLTIPAAVTGGIMAMIIFEGTGIIGIIMLGAFFITGTLATSFKKEQKYAPASSALHDKGRTTGQVLANGGVAAMMALLAMFDTANYPVYILMLAASLSSATADTLSSELGMIYGKKFFNILTWKQDQKGLDGVISLEGTLAGLLGSVLIACIYGCFYSFSGYILIIIISGTIGNLADSILGASLERRLFIGNDLVNFLNTLFAAITAALFAFIYSQTSTT